MGRESELVKIEAQSLEKHLSFTISQKKSMAAVTFGPFMCYS